MRRAIVVSALLVMSLFAAADRVVLAARCTPLRDGKCAACKNCSACTHCSKNGGKCSVCK